MDKRIQLLDASQINRKLLRMAYEIYENNFDEKEIIICGVQGNGITLASVLANKLSEICEASLHVVEILIDKTNPINCSLNTEKNLEKKCIIVVDDVANSGRTLLYALNPFLNVIAKKIQIAVLIDRKHKKYPVAADYIGHLVTTTLQEHIDVVVNKEKVEGAYLM